MKTYCSEAAQLHTESNTSYTYNQLARHQFTQLSHVTAHQPKATVEAPHVAASCQRRTGPAYPQVPPSSSAFREDFCSRVFCFSRLSGAKTRDLTTPTKQLLNAMAVNQNRNNFLVITEQWIRQKLGLHDNALGWWKIHKSGCTFK